MITAVRERTVTVSKFLALLAKRLDEQLRWWDKFRRSDLAELRDAPNFNVSVRKLKKIFEDLQMFQPKLTDLRECYEGERQRVHTPQTHHRIRVWSSRLPHRHSSSTRSWSWPMKGLVRQN